MSLPVLRASAACVQSCGREKNFLKRSFAAAASVQTTAMSVWDDKKALRKTTSKALKELEEATMQEQSTKIADHILHSDFFQQSKRTGVYLTCAKLREVDTSPLLDAILADRSSGRRCYAPCVEDKSSNMNFLHVGLTVTPQYADSLKGIQEMPPYGIREPVQLYSDGRPKENALMMNAPLDLLLMTGQAFDMHGGRLGRGGGYYDKFIARCFKRAQEHGWEPPLLVALGFKEQIVDGEIPKTPNDVDMDVLVLANEVLPCSERGRAAIR